MPYVQSDWKGIVREWTDGQEGAGQHRWVDVGVADEKKRVRID